MGATVAVPAYFDFGQYPKHGAFRNPHDFFHYYLGSKYWRELGYYDIYHAVVIANTENTGKIINNSVRKQTDYNFETAKDIMSRAEEYKAKFSPERWDLFKKDVRYFQSITKESRWPGVTQDKGYNATPVWNMIASTIANYVAPASDGGFFFLVCLDLTLIAAAMALIYAAFGLEAMLFSLVFFCAHYTMSFPHIRGAFLRLDWVMLLVMSVCLLKMGWYKTAGGLTAYAAMARIFPVIFIFGLGAKLLWSAYKKRKLERKYIEYFCVFTVVCAAFLSLNLVYDGGTAHWKQFLDKISMHDQDLSPVRVGFKYIFLDAYTDGGQWGAFERNKLSEFGQSKAEWYLMQLIVLVLCFAAARRLEDYEAMAVGYVPVFFLTAPTFYYHIMVTTVFLFFIPKIKDPWRATGAAFMFGLCIFWYALLQIFPLESLPLSFSMSFSLMILCFVVLGFALFEPTRRTFNPAPSATAEKPAPARGKKSAVIK